MRLRAPLSEGTVRSLELGQEVYVDGTVLIGRDEVHMRALEMYHKGEELPIETKGAILFHCGPIAAKDNGGWRIIAAGPTTSSRMNSLEPEFIKAFGIRAIIGKGGMSAPTVEAMKEEGCVYLAYPGGAAVLAASGIKQVRGVEWLDLGMPEALWIVEAEGLGPLTVAIDAHGRSLYDAVDREVQANLPLARKKLGL